MTRKSKRLLALSPFILHIRLTPTHVGNRFSALFFRFGLVVHPYVRGEFYLGTFEGVTPGIDSGSHAT